VRKTLVPFLLVLAIAASLLNSNAFGSPSLIAYFFFSFLTCLAGIAFFSHFLLSQVKSNYKMPLHIKIYLLLPAYVFAHGFTNENLGFTHFYWGVTAILLLTVNIWSNTFPENVGSADPKLRSLENPIRLIYKGIVFFTIIESIVVLLQCVNVIPTPTNLFLCTGTWINPNVTAMYLSLSLFAFFRLRGDNPKKLAKIIHAIGLSLCILSILLLQSRTAYIVTSILIITEYWASIKNYFKNSFRLNLNGILLVVLAIVGITILSSVFKFKEASTNNRLQIWSTSLKLLAEKPATGFGFGLFEKAYNDFSIKQNLESNDHINMPYNDFLELGVEGGVIAILIWLIFYYQLLKYFNPKLSQQGYFIPLVVSFGIIQITNFGFQAIPANALFILFLGLAKNPRVGQPSSLMTNNNRAVYQKSKVSQWLVPIAGLIISTILLIKISSLTNAFYSKWILSKSTVTEDTVKAYKDLDQKLEGYSSYHESFGDMYIALRQVRPALQQYQTALERSSNPDLLAKVGYCHQLLLNFDSSEYYYLQNNSMQPHRFIPQLYLLKLYKQKKDTAALLSKAQEIVTMPIKVRSKKVFEIRHYAKSIIDSLKNKPM
jgi:tetratricopeptide (TPR) repeat protein